MSKFLNALNGVNVGCPPVFMMRQAGRYHSHYRKIKEKFTFEEICKSPKIAAEVAFGPVAEFGFDAGILFSDILFVLEAIGYNVVFNPGPQITQSVVGFHGMEFEGMEFQAKAIVETQKLFANLPQFTPIIGFVGGLATVHHFLEKSGNVRREHEKMEDFIAQIYDFYLQNILLQINAGADCVAIFDSKSSKQGENYWGVVQKVIDEIKAKTSVPVVYYSDGLGHLNLSEVNCFGIASEHEIIGLLNESKGRAFYGNFDQKILAETPEICQKKIDDYFKNILQKTTQEARKHWVTSLGHGVVKESFEENVKYFINAVRKVF